MINWEIWRQAIKRKYAKLAMRENTPHAKLLRYRKARLYKLHFLPPELFFQPMEGRPPQGLGHSA